LRARWRELIDCRRLRSRGLRKGGDGTSLSHRKIYFVGAAPRASFLLRCFARMTHFFGSRPSVSRPIRVPLVRTRATSRLVSQGTSLAIRLLYSNASEYILRRLDFSADLIDRPIGGRTNCHQKHATTSHCDDLEMRSSDPCLNIRMHPVALNVSATVSFPHGHDASHLHGQPQLRPPHPPQALHHSLPPLLSLFLFCSSALLPAV
jgi:hypothetical protein